MNSADLVHLATGAPSGARRIRTFEEIIGLEKFVEIRFDRIRKPAIPTGLQLPGAELEFYTDGSLRHVGGKVNGRDARRARARARKTR